LTRPDAHGRYSSALPAATPYLFVTPASTVNVDSPGPCCRAAASGPSTAPELSCDGGPG
jgi:hypothetical protein